MILKSIHLQPFACFQDLNIEFESDFNLIFGPNEAGKSTIMSALETALFIPLKYRKNSAQEQYITEKFPLSGGDYLTVFLQAWHRGRDLELKKTFYQDKSQNEAHLQLKDQEYAAYEVVQEKLQQLLDFGHQTYRNSVLINQGLLGDTIKQLRKMDNDSLEQTLRKTVYETEGVSLDAFSEKLSEKIKEINQNWNFSDNRPHTPTSSDRYSKRNWGQILKLYYKKDRLLKEKRELEKLSENLQEKKDKLGEWSEKLKSCQERISELEDLRNNWDRYKEYRDYQKKKEELEDILKKWNNYQKIAREYDTVLQSWTEKIDQKEKGLGQLKKAREYKVYLDLKEKIKTHHEQCKKLKIKIQKLPDITEDKLEELTEKELDIDKLNGKIMARKMSAEIEILADDVSYRIQSGLQEAVEEFNTDQILDFPGFMELEVPDVINVKITGQDIDINDIKGQINKLKGEIKSTLQKYDCQSLEELKGRFKQRKKIEQKLNQEENTVKTLLQTEDLTDFGKLEEILSARKEKDNPFFDRVNNLPEEEDLRTNLDKLKGKKENYVKANSEKKEQFSEWQKKYKTFSGVLDMRDQTAANLKEVQENLPEQFDIEKVPYSSLEELRQKLADLKTQKKEYQQSVNKLEGQIHTQERELDERPSIEEINYQIKQTDSSFQRMKKRGRALKKIQQEFSELKTMIDQKTFDSLKETFADYLSLLTEQRYEINRMNSLGPKKIIKTISGVDFPVNLLSAGTEDCTALALRLALLEDVFSSKESFLVMDEPLINLDWKRKKKAADLITQIADDYQVLIFSCDRDTRELLGKAGQMIELDERM